MFDMITRTAMALLCTLVFAAHEQASAEIMQCFNGAIDDAEVPRASREDIERRCGEPGKTEGNTWFYYKSQFVYRLHFDADGNLYLIQRSHRE